MPSTEPVFRSRFRIVISAILATIALFTTCMVLNARREHVLSPSISFVSNPVSNAPTDASETTMVLLAPKQTSKHYQPPYVAPPHYPTSDEQNLTDLDDRRFSVSRQFFYVVASVWVICILLLSMIFLFSNNPYGVFGYTFHWELRAWDFLIYITRIILHLIKGMALILTLIFTFRVL